MLNLKISPYDTGAEKGGKLILGGKWWEVGRLLAVSLIKMVERLEKFQVFDFSGLRFFFCCCSLLNPREKREENTGYYNSVLVRFLISNKFQLSYYSIVSFYCFY